MPLLMWLFLVPLFGSALTFALFPLPARIQKVVAVLLSLVPLGILLFGEVKGTSLDDVWFSALGIHFHLSVDSISLLFLYLTATIIPFALLAKESETLSSPNLFYGLVLLLETLLIGFFSARDLVLFTIFWEGMLLPLYFIMNIWGGERRKEAALQFLIYMIAGSFLLVAAVLTLYTVAETFNLDELVKSSHLTPHVFWIAAIFFLAFAVKTPLFPFHGWLPEAYTQASTGGTILLSAILSKAGIYGFIRIGTEIFPEQLLYLSPLLLGLAITGVFWGGLAAWAEKDFKRLLAYSSFSHVNFILVGVFAWNPIGMTGSLLQAFNHAVTITALFLVAGWLEIRLGTSVMKGSSGLAKYLPRLCWITLFFVLSSVALPGMNNFIGELMILFALFVQYGWLTAFLGLTVVLSVVYMLRWMQKVYFETPSLMRPSFVDIRLKEMAIALPLMVLILWVGLYPTPLLNQIESATPITSKANV